MSKIKNKKCFSDLLSLAIKSNDVGKSDPSAMPSESGCNHALNLKDYTDTQVQKGHYESKNFQDKKINNLQLGQKRKLKKIKHKECKSKMKDDDDFSTSNKNNVLDHTKNDLKYYLKHTSSDTESSSKAIDNFHSHNKKNEFKKKSDSLYLVDYQNSEPTKLQSNNLLNKNLNSRQKKKINTKSVHNHDEVVDHRKIKGNKEKCLMPIQIDHNLVTKLQLNNLMNENFNSKQKKKRKIKKIESVDNHDKVVDHRKIKGNKEKCLMPIEVDHSLISESVLKKTKKRKNNLSINLAIGHRNSVLDNNKSESIGNNFNYTQDSKHSDNEDLIPKRLKKTKKNNKELLDLADNYDTKLTVGYQQIKKSAKQCNLIPKKLKKKIYEREISTLVPSLKISSFTTQHKRESIEEESKIIQDDCKILNGDLIPKKRTKNKKLKVANNCDENSVLIDHLENKNIIDQSKISTSSEDLILKQKKKNKKNKEQLQVTQNHDKNSLLHDHHNGDIVGELPNYPKDDQNLENENFVCKKRRKNKKVRLNSSLDKNLCSSTRTTLEIKVSNHKNMNTNQHKHVDPLVNKEMGKHIESLTQQPEYNFYCPKVTKVYPIQHKDTLFKENNHSERSLNVANKSLQMQSKCEKKRKYDEIYEFDKRSDSAFIKKRKRSGASNAEYISSNCKKYESSNAEVVEVEPGSQDLNSNSYRIEKHNKSFSLETTSKKKQKCKQNSLIRKDFHHKGKNDSKKSQKFLNDQSLNKISNLIKNRSSVSVQMKDKNGNPIKMRKYLTNVISDIHNEKYLSGLDRTPIATEMESIFPKCTKSDKNRSDLNSLIVDSIQHKNEADNYIEDSLQIKGKSNDQVADSSDSESEFSLNEITSDYVPNKNMYEDQIGDFNQIKEKDHANSIEIKSESGNFIVNSVEIKSESDNSFVDSIEIKSESDNSFVDSIEIKSESDNSIVDSIEIKSESCNSAVDAVEIKSEAGNSVVDAVEIKSEAGNSVMDSGIISEFDDPIVGSFEGKREFDCGELKKSRVKISKKLDGPSKRKLTASGSDCSRNISPYSDSDCEIIDYELNNDSASATTKSFNKLSLQSKDKVSLFYKLDSFKESHCKSAKKMIDFNKHLPTKNCTFHEPSKEDFLPPKDILNDSKNLSNKSNLSTQSSSSSVKCVEGLIIKNKPLKLNESLTKYLSQNSTPRKYSVIIENQMHIFKNPGVDKCFAMFPVPLDIKSEDNLEIEICEPFTSEDNFLVKNSYLINKIDHVSLQFNLNSLENHFEKISSNNNEKISSNNNEKISSNNKCEKESSGSNNNFGIFNKKSSVNIDKCTKENNCGILTQKDKANSKECRANEDQDKISKDELACLCSTSNDDGCSSERNTEKIDGQTSLSTPNSRSIIHSFSTSKYSIVRSFSQTSSSYTKKQKQTMIDTFLAPKK